MLNCTLQPGRESSVLLTLWDRFSARAKNKKIAAPRNLHLVYLTFKSFEIACVVFICLSGKRNNLVVVQTNVINHATGFHCLFASEQIAHATCAREGRAWRLSRNTRRVPIVVGGGSSSENSRRALQYYVIVLRMWFTSLGETRNVSRREASARRR